MNCPKCNTQNQTVVDIVKKEFPEAYPYLRFNLWNKFLAAALGLFLLGATLALSITILKFPGSFNIPQPATIFMAISPFILVGLYAFSFPQTIKQARGLFLFKFLFLALDDKAQVYGFGGPSSLGKLSSLEASLGLADVTASQTAKRISKPFLLGMLSALVGVGIVLALIFATGSSMAAVIVLWGLILILAFSGAEFIRLVLLIHSIRKRNHLQIITYNPIYWPYLLYLEGLVEQNKLVSPYPPVSISRLAEIARQNPQKMEGARRLYIASNVAVGIAGGLAVGGSLLGFFRRK